MLVPWKKSYDQPRQHIKKQRHYIAVKGQRSKAMILPVVMLESESWTIKKTERQRIDAFELWCWRRVLRVPWTTRRSNQSILKEISPEYSLEGLMLKLKLEYFGHLMGRIDLLEKTLMRKAGGKKDDRLCYGCMVSLTWWAWVWASSRSWWWTGRPGMPRSMELQSQTWLSDWIELNWDTFLALKQPLFLNWKFCYHLWQWFPKCQIIKIT